jgi:hypothetical protein
MTINGKAPRGNRPKRAFEFVQQGGGTIQKYHKTRHSATSSCLYPLPGDHSDAPVEKYLNVTLDHETRLLFGYVVPAAEVSQ